MGDLSGRHYYIYVRSMRMRIASTKTARAVATHTHHGHDVDGGVGDGGEVAHGDGADEIRDAVPVTCSSVTTAEVSAEVMTA